MMYDVFISGKWRAGRGEKATRMRCNDNVSIN